MCGIAGILSFNRQALPFGNIQMMTNAMRHRGPDDEGIVFFESDSDIFTSFTDLFICF